MDNQVATFADWLKESWNGVENGSGKTPAEIEALRRAWDHGQEAGHHGGHVDGWNLAINAERERCAKLCEAHAEAAWDQEAGGAELRGSDTRRLMGAATEYLRKREWSMGNGQCPDCCGHPPKWHGHPLFPTANLIGHRLDCTLAASLKELGEAPLMLGDYQSDIVYESYVNEGGFLATRPKTEHGCPKLKKMQQDFEDAVFDSLIGKVFEGIEPPNPATPR